MPSYIAIIHKEPESSFGVSFPDFPGCITAGDTLDEAFKNSTEILPFHMQGLAEDGEPIPEPSNLEAVLADPGHAGGVPVVVNVSPPPGKVLRLNISMDERLVKDLDAAAARLGKTRSAFLADAAREAIRQR